MSKRKLLLADDSITIQQVIKFTFVDEGFEVISVDDGNSALDKLREDPPDIVIADVNMPGLNGYKVCEEIKYGDIHKKVPVILLVGSFEPFDEREANRVGADYYFTKPFQSINELVNSVKTLITEEEEKEDTISTQEFQLEEFEGGGEITASEELLESVDFDRAELAEEINLATDDTENRLSDISEFETVENAEEFEDGASIGKREKSSQIMDLPIESAENLDAQSDHISGEDLSMNENIEQEKGSQASSNSVKPTLDLDETNPLELPLIKETTEERISLAIEEITKEVSDSGEFEDANPKPSSELDQYLPSKAINAIVRKVIDSMSDKVIKEIALEVVPERADSILREIAERRMKS